MRRHLALWAIACAGCGRIAFDPTSSGAASFDLVLSAVTWAAARDACIELGPGYHLAAIAGPEDNAAAATLAATIPFDETQTSTNQRQRMWLGGNDLVEVGRWVWLTDEPFDYANWRAGEPSPNEHCLIMLGSQAGLWDNRPCDFVADAYLCERALE